MNDEQDLRLKCVEIAARQDVHGIVALAAEIEKFVLGKAREAATERWAPPPPPAGYVAPGSPPVVTAEMVGAAVQVLLARPPYNDPAGAFVERIYRAMDAAKPKG